MQRPVSHEDRTSFEFGQFRAQPKLPVAALARRFAETGRLQVDDFLAPDCAAQLGAWLERSDRWRHIFNAGDRTIELPGADWDLTPAENRASVLKLIDEAAAYDFQYQYDTIRVPDRGG